MANNSHNVVTVCTLSCIAHVNFYLLRLADQPKQPLEQHLLLDPPPGSISGDRKTFSVKKIKAD